LRALAAGLPQCNSTGICGGCDLATNICSCVVEGCNCSAVIDCKYFCGGPDNKICAGCDGVPWSGLVPDSCGVCGGHSSCSSSSSPLSSSSSPLPSPSSPLSSSPSLLSSSSSPTPAPLPPKRGNSSSSSSSSESAAKTPYYALWGTTAALYAVLPLLILGGVVCAVYIKFRSMHEGGLPPWLATLLCCCGARARGGRRYQAVSSGRGGDAAQDAEWLADDIEAAPAAAAPAVAPLSPNPVPVPKPAASRPAPRATSATTAAAPTAAPAATDMPGSPLAPPPKSNWDVQWDDEDGEAWGDFPAPGAASKKPKSIGH